MTSTREFTNISRDQLADFRSELKKYGVNVPDGDDVKISAPFGVKMHAVYVEESKALTLSILDKPVFVPESQIWGIVDKTAEKLK